MRELRRFMIVSLLITTLGWLKELGQGLFKLILKVRKPKQLLDTNFHSLILGELVKTC